MVDGFVRRILAPGLIFLCASSWSANAHAGAIGLIGADLDTGTVSAYLASTGMFDSVTRLPQDSSLATLSAYDAILVWSNSPYTDAASLGDRLADYVDAGGGVVVATFSFFAPNFDLRGRIATPAYSPFSIAGPSLYSPATLGSHDPASPIMTGVSSLTGYFRDAVLLNSGATLVASWSDGNPLAAWNHGGQVVGVALYPGEATLQGLSGQYPQLFANALVFAAGTNAVPEPGTLGLLALPLLAGLGFGRRRASRTR